VRFVVDLDKVTVVLADAGGPSTPPVRSTRNGNARFVDACEPQAGGPVVAAPATVIWPSAS
jgi:hypothetical protein